MALIWTLEWRTAGVRRRTFALNLLVPLLLVLPIALSDAPPAHAAAVYAVLFTIFGTFGAAIPLVRDAESGLLQRIALTGLAPRRLILERTLAQAALDTLQLLPALLVIAATGEGDAGAAVALPVILAGALVVANALGHWVAALARSVAETALFAAVAALFALHGAGVFRSPAPGTLAARLEHLIPFRHLHEALLRVVGGAAFPTTATLVTGSLLGAAAALALSATLAPALISSVTRRSGH